MTYLFHWLAHALSSALDRLTHYADPWPYCRSCGRLYDPTGEGHAAACRQWGR